MDDDAVTAEAWAALRMIRKAIETFGRTSLESEEAVLALRGPAFTDEAAAIVEAIQRLRAPLDYQRTVIQRLHDVEINAGIQSFYDDTWTVWTGDPLNGTRAVATVESLAECEQWLYEEARRTIFTPAVAQVLAEH